MTKEIAMRGKHGEGKYAIVSDHRYEELSKYKWSVRYSDNTWYAKTKMRDERGVRRDILMHRIITGVTDPKIKVDHADRNGWNNTDENLRIATDGQNQYNRPSNRNSTSQYKGVSWNSQLKKWFCRIAVDNKETFIGLFDINEHAAYSYDTYARMYHGEFARLNFPDIHWTIEDVQNARYYHNRMSGFIGVTRNKNGYIARVEINGKRVYLGWFKDPVEAAKVRDRAIIDNGLTGRRLNFRDDYPDYVA